VTYSTPKSRIPVETSWADRSPQKWLAGSAATLAVLAPTETLWKLACRTFASKLRARGRVLVRLIILTQELSDDDFRLFLSQFYFLAAEAIVEVREVLMDVLGVIEVRIVVQHVMAILYPFFVPWDKLGSGQGVTFRDV